VDHFLKLRLYLYSSFLVFLSSKTPPGSGKRLQPALLQSVVDHIATEENNSEISRATGVTRNCIGKVRVSLEYWEVPYPSQSVRIGQPATLRQRHLNALKQYLLGQPQAYLEEMRDWLYDEFNTQTTIQMVFWALEKLKWLWKLGSKRAKEQSSPLCCVYTARIAQHYTTEMIVAVDESACNECTGDWKYGWSLINKPVELVYNFKRSERWLLLPAMTVDGYLSYMIFQGLITLETMEHFLEFEVLPHCNLTRVITQ
jgi:hypothetical protein